MNGGELFRETEAEFDYFHADAYGIYASLVVGAYQGLSLDDAREIRDELDDIIEHCEQYEEEFPSL